nr:hypothetical protein [Tanacetum cinerariifolium]
TPSEPVDSLSLGDEHLNTILATESDEFIKSCVENFVPNPSESEGENECDVPAGFTTFSNVLFDADYDFDSDQYSFNAESDLIESMPNHDSSITISSKVDSLFDEFIGKLTLLKSIPPGIDETDCHPEKETNFAKRLLYDNSSPRPPEEIVSDNSNADIESFSPSPIPNKDSDSRMEEINLPFTPNDPMPAGIEDDDYDSGRDIPIFKQLLDNYSLSLPANESYHFDIPSPYRPPAKPPDGNTGTLNIKMIALKSQKESPLPSLPFNSILIPPLLILMTSFGYRLNPRYAIKECSSCGSLYTRDCYCSKGSVEDKILVPKPPENYARCAKCGHPFNGPYCQGCTLLREKLEEDLVTYFQKFLNTFESSDGSTNVVNAPREPFSTSDEDFLKKIYLNPLFDEEINPMNIDQHSFNAESDLIESMPNHDSSIIISSKIDSLFDEFASELTLLKSISPGIDETDCHPEKETRLPRDCCTTTHFLVHRKKLFLKILMLILNLSLHLLSPIRIVTLCGEALDGIYCQQCICKSCGKGAHIGYNCPLKVLIIFNPEPCNQTMNNELPQTLPSFDTTCYSDKENSVPCVSKPNFIDESSNIFNPPSQLPIYYCEFCGRNAQYGHYYTPQAPFINPEPGYSQDFNFPKNIHDFQQQYLCCDQCGGPHENFQCQQVIFYEPCCEYCGGPHENFQCQPLNYCEPNPSYDSYYSGFDQFGDFCPQQYLCCENCEGPHETFQCQPTNEDYYHEKNSCYNSNSFGADHCQPPQYTVNHPIFDAHNDLLSSRTTLMEQMTTLTSMCEMVCQIFQKKQEEKRIKEEQAAITPVLSTEETDNSLSMGDEHLDTILATESDEVIMSSVEDLVPIPIEFEDTPDTIDDDSLYNKNIEYIEASPHDSELVSLEAADIVIPEVEEIEDDNLREKLLNVHLLIANIEALKNNPTPSSKLLTKSSSTSPKSFLEETNTFYNSLPEFENFCFDLEKINSGSTTTHSDISLPDYEVFYFDDDHIEEISSGSTTTHSDISLSGYDSFVFDPSNDQFPPTNRSDFANEEFVDELAHIISPPEYDCFYFWNLPDPGELMSILNSGIRENLSTTSVNLPVEDDHFLILAYVVWIFLAYLTISGNLKTLAKGFYPPSLHFLSFILGIMYLNLID